MKLPRAPHSWSVTPKRAIQIQKELASTVRSTKPRGQLRFVAGVDAAFTADDKGVPICIAAAVVWDREERRVIEEGVARRKLTFPYVPGLLSFREAPTVLAALRKLRSPVDVILCDGHGLAHPRRFGLACHLGVVCDLPTVGCAKSRLVGEHGELAIERGSRVPLVHDGHVVGTVLRTRAAVRPVYVSVGHNIDLKTAERLVLETAVRFRLPEPSRLADRLVARVKREV
jgi:deoxyribonuclease V